jgi:hypothetical protein
MPYSQSYPDRAERKPFGRQGVRRIVEFGNLYAITAMPLFSQGFA